VVTPGRINQVDVEDCAERVLVGHSEEAERADDHVHVDGLRPAPERTSRIAPLQNAGGNRHSGGVELGERRRPRDELGAVHVLDRDQADEVLMRLVMIEGQLGQRADGRDRV
jgi:hypothetical protein